VVEGDRFLTLQDQILIDDIQHFEKGHIGADVPCRIGNEATPIEGVLLAPDMECQIHYL
jgi:hypothetical protein